jgi:hypothetical protein
VANPLPDAAERLSAGTPAWPILVAGMFVIGTV